MAYRLTDQHPVYLNNAGQICAGGSLHFYVNNTTTPAVTYSDTALSVSNGSNVTLTTAGRSPVDIWSGVTIRVVLKDAAGSTIWTRDDVQAGSQLPSLIVNGFLNSADGVNLQFSTIRQCPDPTGASGKFVYSADGINFSMSAVVLSSGAGAVIKNWVGQQLWEKQQTIAAAGTTAIDWSAGSVIKLTQDVAITAWTMANIPAAGTAAVLTIFRVKDNTATARLITWPAGTKWPGGVAPTLSSTANAVDVVTLITYDGGTTYYGSYVTGMA